MDPLARRILGLIYMGGFYVGGAVYIAAYSQIGIVTLIKIIIAAMVVLDIMTYVSDSYK